jgi:hypothetical protein
LPTPRELPQQVRADETGPADHEDFHGTSLLFRPASCTLKVFGGGGSSQPACSPVVANRFCLTVFDAPQKRCFAAFFS